MPLLEHVIGKAKPQVAQLLLSANGDPQRFSTFRLPMVADIYADQGGPLAGIISAMAYTSKMQPQPKWLATFPCDAPLAPAHWVSLLRAAASQDQPNVIITADPEQTHYTFALWSYQCFERLKQQYAVGQRALHKVVQTINSRVIVCSQDTRPFTNLNTPADLQRLTAIDCG